MTSHLSVLATFIHIVVTIIVLIGPFICNNRYALYGIILLDVIIIYSWYIYGECILTILEREDDETYISIGKQICEKIRISHNIIDAIPFLSIMVCFYGLEEIYLQKMPQ